MNESGGRVDGPATRVTHARQHGDKRHLTKLREELAGDLSQSSLKIVIYALKCPRKVSVPRLHRATFTKSRMATIRFSETMMIEPFWSIV
jgi:hypothetical protein